MVWLITIPFIAGLLVLLSPKFRGLKEGIGLSAAVLTLILAVIVFIEKPLQWSYSGLSLLRIDELSSYLLLAAGLFGVLIVLYSFGYMAGKPRAKEYYAYLIFTLGAACGVLQADHLVLLLVFWGILGITLYLLTGLAGPSSADAAKKAFIIVGGSDAFLLLGIVLIWVLTGSWGFGTVSLPLRGGVSILAFSSLLIAALAKVGAMPLHSWLPDVAEKGPVPATAFLPAALDKIVGIYLLARICLGLFQLTPGAYLALCLIGAVTIMGGVMMALIQHDANRLLGFHAVSQAGYMILGLGTGTAIGIAGGLFHMLNNAIYKQGLFLAGGAVKHRKGTSDLSRLGGLARVMPWTFGAFILAALAISGVPPLNGFVSKWMVYQGVIEMGRNGAGLGAKLWVVWLLAALFGSALTLASFMKLLHAIFLGAGEEGEGAREREEVSWKMLLPMGVLALLCIVLGVFSYQLVIDGFLTGAVPGLGEARSWIGIFRPGLVTGLIVLGLLVGWLIYKLGNLKGLRVDTPYIGGEKFLPVDERVTGTEFYATIKELPLLKPIYGQARKGNFDIYRDLKGLFFYFIDILKSFHSGVLTHYLSWAVLGLLFLLFILLRGAE